MAEPSVPRVVVVADPDDARDITELLASVNQPVAWSGDGDDETLARLQADPVDVVVLSAGLSKGDARSFARAARGDDEWEVSIVLVGELDGPVRNALDAADFDVDRFVGRPLSPKALRFAIKNCRPGVPREIPPSRSQQLALVPGEDSTFDGVGEEPPAPRKVSQRIETATDLAIDAFLQDAMAALPESATDEGWTDAVASSPEAAGPVSSGAGGHGQGQGHVEDSNDGASDGGGDAPAEASPPWREPTMILSGGSSAAPQSVHDAPTRRFFDDGSNDGSNDEPPATEDAAGATDDRGDDGLAMADDEAGAGAAGGADAATDGDPLDDVGDDGDGDTDGDALAASSGPMYGEQLRAKMSAMAERLFPDRNDAAAAVSAPLSTDADIDLATLGAGSDDESLTDSSTLVPGLDDEAPLADDAVGAPGHLQGEIDVTASRRLSRVDGGIAGPGQTAERDADTINGSLRIEPDAGGDGPGGDKSAGADVAEREADVAAIGGSERRGTLADTDTATLLAQLYRDRHTGELVITRDDAVKTLYLEQGRPVFATSNLSVDRMGDLLYREGKITRAQHVRSREVVAESRHRMGELLVEMGFIKKRELVPAVRRHLEDLVYSLFAWSSGSYSIGPGQGAPNESIRLTRHPAGLIVEGVRRKYGLDVLESKLGAPASVLAVPDPDSLAGLVRDIDLGASERAICDAFDGERALRDVARVAGAELLTVYQLGFALVVLGVAQLRRTSDQAGDWNDPVRPPMLVGETELAIDRQRVLAKHEHVNDADYFRLLGVRRDASAFEIKRAYESARRDYAVESFPAEVRRELSREIDEINDLLEEAYRVLRDDHVRGRYRHALRD